MDTSPSELILLDGTVSSVIYRNEENGYTILRLEAPEAGEEVTVVGTMPGISPGEGLSVHGQWTRHSTYGEQFRAEIDAARAAGDSVGGSVECAVTGLPAGLGGPLFGGLEDQAYPPPQVPPDRNKHFSQAEPHGGVPIVSARVHQTGPA